MIEVRFHGRGGQGAVIASNILAEAAFLEGKAVAAFPYFGVERRGAPVTAYTRIDDREIRIKSGIYEPDYVIVMDQSLVKAVDVVAGLKPGGKVIINTTKSSESFELGDVDVSTVDATGIAIENRLGSKAAPIVNSAILGGFAKISGVVQLDSLVKSVKAIVPVKKDENATATEQAFGRVVVE
ncbi:MAG: 2-oxoacid:acceptor oxidoreductase family protein [Thermoplasmata archaeon]|nr:2-oxoacid:acceptor oxidoreductase family protein [Thermoplasmata archaeon]